MAADGGVVIGYGARSAMRDPPRERAARQPRAWEINNVGVAKKIVEEWLDGFGHVGATQLEHHYADAFAFAHAQETGGYFKRLFRRSISSLSRARRRPTVI
jgi:hypothetical protein